MHPAALVPCREAPRKAPWAPRTFAQGACGPNLTTLKRRASMGVAMDASPTEGEQQMEEVKMDAETRERRRRATARFMLRVI